MNFGQLLTAMVTPFNGKGEIDFPATKNLVNHLINTGSEGIVVSGTTGESPTLTFEEKIALFDFVVETTSKRVPIIAGTGSNNTRESISLTIEAEKVGVDGIMLVAPYYSRPSQLGIKKHFEAIANQTSLPIMLYNIPGRTGVNMTVETIVALTNINNIVAIKEASGNLNAVTEIIRQTSDNFFVYGGDDDLTLPMLSIGSHGIVSVSSHIIGNEMKEMISTYMNGNVNRATAIHQKLLPVMDALFSAPNPTPVKAALNMIGIPVGSVRLPLVSLTDEESTNLKNILQIDHNIAM